jgi:hypothetical protein
MLNKLNSIKLSPKYKNISFQSKESYLFKGMDKTLKPLNAFVKSQENLSHTRFFQDVATNWVPKVVFTRSLADFTEMTFLEYTESSLFYFAPPIFGQFFRKLFSGFNPKSIQKDVTEHILKPSSEIVQKAQLKDNTVSKRALSTKAAILLACVSIPAAEYALSFAKNLLTLKLFNKSDFNNVINLNKNENTTESEEQQNRVKNSAYKHIKNATKLSLASLGGAFLLASIGHKSEILQKVSKTILQPNEIIYKLLNKVGIQSKKVENALKTYMNFDFNIKNDKLALSKGQLVVSTFSGFLGYSEAGKDRGKLDQLEVWTRVPIVVFYTIFGGEIFDHAFKHILYKHNKFPDLIKEKKDGFIIKVPTREELPELAEKIAKIKKTSPQVEFNRLLKEKTIITAIPYGFSLLFMGFLLAGITRFWTQYRYDRSQNEDAKQNNFNNFIKPKNLFKQEH